MSRNITAYGLISLDDHPRILEIKRELGGSQLRADLSILSDMDPRILERVVSRCAVSEYAINDTRAFTQKVRHLSAEKAYFEDVGPGWDDFIESLERNQGLEWYIHIE